MSEDELNLKEQVELLKTVVELNFEKYTKACRKMDAEIERLTKENDYLRNTDWHKKYLNLKAAVDELTNDLRFTSLFDETT